MRHTYMAGVVVALLNLLISATCEFLRLVNFYDLPGWVKNGHEAGHLDRHDFGHEAGQCLKTGFSL